MPIVKSLSRKSNSSQLVKYIFRYMLKEEKTQANQQHVHNISAPFILKHNVRSRTIKGFIREFEENEAYRLVKRKDSVKLFHTVISFSDKDAHLITDKLLKDIGKKFIEERGLNNLYLGTQHLDKGHIHLHIAISGTQLNGRSSRITKQQFHHIKLELDKYQRQKYPQLIHSLPQHGKSKQLTKEAIIEQVKEKRQTHKESLLTTIESTFKKSTSRDHFVAQLKDQGQEVYYRDGKLQGLIYEGQKFRFSRLGYDRETLEFLDLQKNKEEKELLELEKVRKEKPRELVSEEIAVNSEFNDVINLEHEEQQAMQELVAIREKSFEQEKIMTQDPDDVSLKEQENDLSQLRKRSLNMDRERDLLWDEEL